jgi:hypothetical protein
LRFLIEILTLGQRRNVYETGDEQHNACLIAATDSQVKSNKMRLAFNLLIMNNEREKERLSLLARLRLVGQGQRQTRPVVLRLLQIVNVDHDVLVAGARAHLERHVVGQLQGRRVAAPREQDRLGALAHQTAAAPRVGRRDRLLATKSKHVMGYVGVGQWLYVG